MALQLWTLVDAILLPTSRVALHPVGLPTTTSTMENTLREQAAELFRKNNFTAALEKYTAAIAINNKNAVLYANRAACHSALCK